jgi:hypothetical protein
MTPVAKQIGDFSPPASVKGVSRRLHAHAEGQGSVIVTK